jgi:cobalt/nickel transport system permease protein
MFDPEILDRNHLILRIDPRIKIVSYLILALEISLINSINVILIAVTATLTGILVLRIPIRVFVKKLAQINMFLLFFWVVLPFTYTGNEIFTIYGLSITSEGINYCFLITLKSNCVLLILFLLIGTMSSMDFGHAMISMGVSKKLTFLFLFTWRYLDVMWRELSQMLRALKARNFEPKTNLRTYKTFAFLVAMLLIKAYERSKRIQMAMVARGFQGRYHSLKELQINRCDLIFQGTVLCLAFILGYLEWI